MSRRSTGRRGAALLLAGALAFPAWAQDVPPAIPDAWRFGTRVDHSTLTYCVDPRDPSSVVERQIAEAIAGALLLEPEPVVIGNQSVQQELDDLYLTLLESCDIYLGFKLLPQAYPTWLMLTRPYYAAEYVVVVADEGWNALEDMPRSMAIGSTLGTSADLRLIPFLASQPADRRWRRFPMGTNQLALNALLEGAIGAALVWEPALWAMQNADPAFAKLRVVAPDPLPASSEGVGAALLTRETFIRTALDEAIAALARDGTIASMLAEHEFPATVVP